MKVNYLTDPEIVIPVSFQPACMLSVYVGAISAPAQGKWIGCLATGSWPYPGGLDSTRYPKAFCLR